ncbi:MAG TPA: lamin tail domain-containing protein [Cytophagaceae bacterium]|nr:lamin tail domain-containing protein [Cytophagaceae bacterium]
MQRSYLLLVFLAFGLSAHAQLTETFSDSNFTANPEWLGKTTFFKISNDLKLQSNGPKVASLLHLSTPNSRCLDTQWDIYAELNFDITTSNYARFYLTSDRSDTENNPKGYYLKFDGTSNSIDFYRQDSTKHTKLISGKAGRAGKKSMNIFLLRILCDPYGNWHLYTDSTGSGNHFVKEGQAYDTTFSTSAYCGVYVVHSSTKGKLFYFDDLYIRQAPLCLLSAETIAPNIVALTFNHPVDIQTASDISNYDFYPSNMTVQSVTVDVHNRQKVLLQLSSAMHTGISYSISTHGMLDEQLQPLGFLNTVNFSYHHYTTYGDLILTELFPDPSPSQSLPESEYAEIYNRTNDTLNLQNFSISDGSSTGIFSACKLAPHQYMLLCNTANSNAWKTYGTVLGLPVFPSLNNSGDSITLRDQHGNLLHQVDYTDLWYGDNDKKEGGWSLEMIDVDNPCGEADNWAASIDPSGGTPGKINSIAAYKPDRTAPQLISAVLTDSLHILLTFDEKPDTTGLETTAFLLDKNYFIQKIIPAKAFQLFLLADHPFEKGELYTLTLTGIKDCNGNPSLPQTVTLVLPEEAKPGDILLNELLFNPKPGGYDFVELYNASEKYIDLKNWQLANIDKEIIANKKPMSLEPFIVKPKEYIAFTENKSMLLNYYPLGHADRIVQLQDLPSFNDDQGSVILLDSRQQIQDRFDYSEEMHFPMIDDKEGVSLERISIYENTDNPSNWHSASSQSGYATPGYKNSESIEQTKASEVWVSPKVFTPDEDGNKDFTLLYYKFDNPGNMANIIVYDPSGRTILYLARNELLATEGCYRWDGNNEKNEKVRSGNYILYFEVFNLKGEVKKYKEVVVVGWSD